MKKTVVALLICVAMFIAGIGVGLVGDEKTASIEPLKFSTLTYDDIFPNMYIASEETVVYGGFAYFGESETSSQTDYYVTITGLDTAEGAQYIGFAIPSQNSYAAEDHIDKTIEWLQDESMTAPTGYPIKGVVKEMSGEMRIYFEEFFTDNEILTQEEIDANPTLLSYYYIDTTAQPDTYRIYTMLSIVLTAGSVFAVIIFIIVAASNKNKARYKKDYSYASTANSANTNLNDSTDVPLGFDK